MGIEQTHSIPHEPQKMLMEASRLLREYQETYGQSWEPVTEIDFYRLPNNEYAGVASTGYPTPERQIVIGTSAENPHVYLTVLDTVFQSGKAEAGNVQLHHQNEITNPETEWRKHHKGLNAYFRKELEKTLEDK